MTSLAIDTLEIPQAQQVVVTDDSLVVDLCDGRTISVPLAWYPRLLHGSPDQRNNWRLTGSKEGIHWPDLDEDISIKNMILGQPSAESQKSFQRWLEERAKRVQQITASEQVNCKVVGKVAWSVLRPVS